MAQAAARTKAAPRKQHAGKNSRRPVVEQLSPQEQIEQLIAESLESFPLYAERHLRIQDAGQLKPFKLHEIQMIIDAIWADMEARQLLIRLIILKARREGVSTYTTAKFFFKVANNFNRYSVTVAHEPEASDFIFKMSKRYYDNLPPELKPQTKYNNTKQLEFNNPEGTGLDSAMRVGTAGKSDFGSSMLITYLHLSELAKWPAGTQESLLTSLLQAVPDKPDSAVVIESTAKGIGGEFHSRYKAARYRYVLYLDERGEPTFRFEVNKDGDRNNAFCSIFIPWFVFKDYEMDPEPGFRRTAKEEVLAAKHRLTDRKLQWRRYAIATKCNGKEDTFKQEYPSTADEAFLTSGRTVFDAVKCQALQTEAPEPKARYEYEAGAWVARPDGRLEVWKEPGEAGAALIAADVAEGLEKGDFSCADVLDHATGEQLAQWHGHIDPDLFGTLLVALGQRYRNAWIAPERNNHGFTTVKQMLKLHYKRIYVERIDDPPNLPRMRFGWHTTGNNKTTVIDALHEVLRDNPKAIKSKATLGEMMTFKHVDDKMEAEVNCFDDRVMSMAIGQHVRKIIPIRLKAAPVTGAIHTGNSATAPAPPTGGWT